VPLRLCLVLLASALLSSCRTAGGSSLDRPATAPATTTSDHRFATERIGTAIVQDYRDGLVRFDFTADDGETLPQLRVRAAEIADLRGTWLEPGARLRLRLIRDYVQPGSAAPREAGRRWELLRTP
jgi:hypothetical protein